MDQIPVFIPHLSAVYFHGKQTARFHRLHPFAFTVSRLLQSGGDLITVLLGSPVRCQVACQQDRADAREQPREQVDHAAQAQQTRNQIADQQGQHGGRIEDTAAAGSGQHDAHAQRQSDGERAGFNSFPQRRESDAQISSGAGDVFCGLIRD